MRINYNKSNLYLLFFLLIFLLSFSAWAKVPIIEMDTAKALYVVDGDSISLSMRIKDIDTPETKQICRKIATEIINCGIIAKQHLQVLLNRLPGKLTIVPISTGHYGFILFEIRNFRLLP
jgi:endonuclease YncB( thermonuclease family)